MGKMFEKNIFVEMLEKEIETAQSWKPEYTEKLKGHLNFIKKNCEILGDDLQTAFMVEDLTKLNKPKLFIMEEEEYAKLMAAKRFLLTMDKLNIRDKADLEYDLQFIK